MQMPAKNRGKSAAIVSDHISLLNADLPTSSASSSLPLSSAITTALSPLRIESVIPSRNKNVNNRLIHRSYSTLNLNYLKTLISDSQRKNELLDQQLKETIQNVNTSIINGNNESIKQLHSPQHQTGKQITNGTPINVNSTSSSSSSSIVHTTKFTNGTNHNNIVNGTGSGGIGGGNDSNNHHQHGFWRIQRTHKEKEKHPDRINLDRRGLTTLPIIENEPNLRLLSLQHNLINSFCVPALNSVQIDFGDDAENGDGCLSVTVECEKSVTNKRNTTNYLIQQQQQRTPTVATANKSSLVKQSNNGRRLLRAQSIQKPSSSSSSTMSRNFSNSNSALTSIQQRLTNSKLNGNANNDRCKKGAPITRENSISSKTSTLAPKSALLHSKERYVLKKSNSFINNYSRHLVATKAHLGRLIQNRMNVNAINGNGSTLLTNQSSLSSDSIPDVELQPPTEMLIVKNDPFSGFAASLENLVFLDLYDNQIERISNLDGLRNLTVLLLGKNRISDIAGICSVRKTLRVLDLHGNKISTITQKICQLHELKSLNLAGNSLKQIQNDDFKGLTQLKELNIKRNRIRKINGFDDLCALERLWLCHNDLQKVDDMWCIAKAINLREVTVENNPVSLAGDCVSFLVSYLPHLMLLSQMQVTDQVRRAAMNWRKNKELCDASSSEPNSDLYNSIRREEVISNARTNWELLRQQQPMTKISNYIQKTLNNTTKQLQIVRTSTDLDIDACSNLSENVLVDRKAIRQKAAQSTRKNLKKPVTAKMRRSLSEDNTPTAPTEFRLPPILPAMLGNNATSDPNLSTSSVATNIGTTSSHFSSDGEENSKKNEEHVANGNEYEINQHESVSEQSQVGESDLNSVSSVDPIPISKFDDENRNDQATMAEDLEETRSKTELPLHQENANENLDKQLVISDGKNVVESLALNVSLLEKPVQKGRNSCKRSCQHTLQRANTAKVISLYSPMPTGTTTPTPTKPSKQLDREREQGGDYLIEICGRYLNVYGSGAIKFIDRQWNAQKANDVHTLKFSYVNYNNVASIFGRIKNRFPNAEHFTFRETNIQYLGQLNSLAELQGLSSLIIDPDGNGIFSKLWRQYAIYRLAHWGIKTINDIEITTDEIDEAQKTYSGLSNLVLWSLPESLVEPLLFRLHLESCSTAEKLTAKQWLMNADQSLRLVVGKEALQSKFPNGSASSNTNNLFNNESEFRLRGRQCLANMMENTYNAVEKLQKLETMWSNMLLDMIKATLLDYAQIDTYLDELMTNEVLNTPTSRKQ